MFSVYVLMSREQLLKNCASLASHHTHHKWWTYKVELFHHYCIFLLHFSFKLGTICRKHHLEKGEFSSSLVGIDSGDHFGQPFGMLNDSMAIFKFQQSINEFIF